VTPPLQVPNISARVCLESWYVAVPPRRTAPVGEYEGLIEGRFQESRYQQYHFRSDGNNIPLIEAKPFQLSSFRQVWEEQRNLDPTELPRQRTTPDHRHGLLKRSVSLRLETNQPGERSTAFLKLKGQERLAGRLTL